MKWLAVMLNCMLLSPLLVVPALAYHFNNPGYSLVHELLIQMRERGMNVWVIFTPMPPLPRL